MSDDPAPIRNVSAQDLPAFLKAQPHDRMPVAGHEGHWVIEAIKRGGREGWDLHLRCSCGRWFGGAVV